MGIRSGQLPSSHALLIEAVAVVACATMEKPSAGNAVAYVRPPKRTFIQFFYDSKTHAVFGRTGSSWGKSKSQS